MRTRLTALISLTAILIVVFCCNDKYSNIDSETKNKIKNLEVFSKLYGYVRYFHPSDEAASINWDKFLYYGIEQVLAVDNDQELLETLENLFLPIVPTISLYESKNKLKSLPKNLKSGDKVLVTWQHKGVGIKENSTYKSVRLNRVESENFYNMISKDLPITDYSNKKFRIYLKGEANKNSVARIELSTYTSNYKDSIYSKTISSEEWDHFLFEGEFLEKTKYLYLNLGLLEKGAIKIEDLQLLLIDDEGITDTLIAMGNNWEAKKDANGIVDWDTYGYGYTYEVVKKDDITYLHVQNQDKVIPGSLFEKYPRSDEIISKKLGNGISCRIPLALFLSKEKSTQFSAAYDSLNAKLENVILEDTTAQLEPTRIGAVISAWNIFSHFYPYFDVIETDWDNVLTETLIKVLQDNNASDCMTTLLEMTAFLEDGHAGVYHPFRKKLRRLPMLFDFIDNQLVVIASNDKQLERGDIIIEIDDQDASKSFKDLMKIASGSPQWKKTRSFYRFTSLDSNMVSQLKVKRADEILTISVNRKGKAPKVPRPENISKINEDIMYVNLDEAPMEEIEKRIEEIAKSKGVIFDLRGYPNGNHDVISYMIDTPVRSARWNVPQIVYPDLENITGYDTSGRWTIEPKQPRLQGEIVFLTDGSAISYAESFMGIIEHYKLAEIIGSATAGANGNVNPFSTMGGFRFYWTGMKVLKHDGSQHHLIGIKPTIPIKPTLKGIREGRDEVLEKAIEVLSN